MKPLDIQNQLIPILCLGSMSIGLLMPMFLPKSRGIKKRSAVVFVFSLMVLIGNWYMQEPGILANLEKNIEWALVGLVLIILKIRSSRERPPDVKPPTGGVVEPVNDLKLINPVKKVLILSANPKSTPRLRLDEEVREIEEGLHRSKYRERFRIQAKWAVRLRDLRRALLDVEPHIVHFTGHGKENGLVVEDESGSDVLVSVPALSELFALFSCKIECVLLSACYSESQATTINRHIDFVIGMRREIDDKASIEFAVGFYDALGAGKSVEEAFKFGCNAIRLFNLPKRIMPVLKKN
jgi:hypothetical protein